MRIPSYLATVVAVVSAFTLPAQPASGNAIFHPLGGDGWISPRGVYAVQDNLVNDASGGTGRTTVTFDPRFEGILTHCQALFRSFGGQRDVSFDLVQKPLALGLRASAFGTSLLINNQTLQSLFTWTPPLLTGQGEVTITTDNTDGGTVHTNLWIYVFNIRVFEKTPLNVILASLPRTEGQNVVL